MEEAATTSGWCVPVRVLAGHHEVSIMWETLRQNTYCKVQKHVCFIFILFLNFKIDLISALQHGQGRPLSKLLGAIRSVVSSAAEFRIILNSPPWHAICFEPTEAAIVRRFHELLALDQVLRTMSGQAWYQFLCWWATEKAAGHEPALPAVTTTAAKTTADDDDDDDGTPSHPKSATVATAAAAEAASASTTTSSECKVCFERESDHAMVPCGHQALCSVCATAHRWEFCPICRAPVSTIIKVYKA